MARGRTTSSKKMSQIKDEHIGVCLKVSESAVEAPSMGQMECYVDNASNRNVGTRINALRQLHLAFGALYLPEFVEKYSVTLLDVIQKNIDKSDNESVLASLLVAHLSIQAGEITTEMSDVYASLRSVISNEAKSERVRSMAALCLAVSTYLSCEEDNVIGENIEALHDVWISVENLAESSQLFRIAVSGWALLLQNDPSALHQALDDYSELTSYLEADHQDIKMACGEAIASIYELARDSAKSNYQFPNHNEVVDIINKLTSESVKQTSKKDRGTFRDSNKYLRDCMVSGDKPSVHVKFGTEEMKLTSCGRKIFYDLCSEVLHGGMNRHLEENEQLREVFDLGAVCEEDGLEDADKATKMAHYNAASKYRDQIRGGQRDSKRAVVF